MLPSRRNDGMGREVVRARLIALLAPPIVAALYIAAPSVVAVIVPLGASIVLIAAVCRTSLDDVREFTTVWAFRSLVLHVVLGALIVSSAQLTQYVGPDGAEYDAIARLIVAHWDDPTVATYSYAGKEGYPYLLASIYAVFGIHPVAGAIVNAALSAMLVPVLVDTTRRVLGVEEARVAAGLVTLLPAFLIWPSGLLREAPTLFVLAIGANAAVRMMRALTPAPYVAFGGALVLLLTLRPYVAVSLAIGTAMAFAVGRRRMVAIAGGLVASGAFVVLLASGVGSGGAGTIQDANFNRLDQIRTGSATAATTGFAEESSIGSPAKAIAYLPVGLAATLLGPLPWQVRSVRHLPLLVDAVVWWSVLPLAVRSFRAASGARRQQLRIFVLPAALVCLVISLLIANFGTITRARTQMLLLLLPVIASGVVARRRRRLSRRTASSPTQPWSSSRSASVGPTLSVRTPDL
jgi:hypothetical protein